MIENRTRLILMAALWCALPAKGVIFFSTADPDYNTTAPTGELANSGWELQGNWGYFLGTPISSKHFITAKHLGGVVGEKFILNGTEYTTVAYFDDPASDLRIWKVSGRFPAFAELYSGADEVGKNLAVFGRGTQRGEEVGVSGLLGSVRKGWQWGLADGRKRWGENQVGGLASSGRNADTTGGAAGDLLRVPFNARGGLNEAHLSAGDSGGGVFIDDGAGWKLAGINFTVDGAYNTSDSGPGFAAAIFDEGGLYKGRESNWTKVPDTVADLPGAFYATRISVRLDWITSVLAQPSASDPVVLQSAPAVTGPYTDEPSASTNSDLRLITLPQPSGHRFYRLRGPPGLWITELKVEGGSLILRYE
ncbi:MAG: hypothetical protein HY735_17305 [Verrucomicrobia bacterium]|nr:hypothetical protein [Verrucomicrobiota bacterium]